MHDTKTKSPERHRPRGMPHLEVVVAIIIVGLIVTAVGVSLIPRLEEAELGPIRMDLKNIQAALERYHTEKGEYPDTSVGLRALVETRNLEKIPRDPWGREYVYVNEDGDPVIACYGADGTPGGAGHDADISSRGAKARK